MKPLIPKQHGAWAMLIIPFWIGALAGEVTLGHGLLFAGWFFLYLGSYAILMAAKRKKTAFYVKWATLYMSIAVVLILYPVFERPLLIPFGLLFIPFFMISYYYSSKNRDRSLINDLSAIAVFSIAGMASYFYGSGHLNNTAIFVTATSFLFFLGSTFYVKSMIRERKNSSFKVISWSYHVAVLFLWAILGQWLVLLAFVPSLLRAILFHGKQLPIIKLGIYEIANATIFFLLLLPVIL